MPEELFRSVAVRRAPAGRRFGAVPLSAALHVVLLLVIVIAPLVATDVLPVPHAPFVLQLPSVPTVVVPRVPPRHLPQPALPRPDMSLAPLVAPQGVGKEIGLAIEPSSIPQLSADDAGLVPGIPGGATEQFADVPQPPQPPPMRPVKTGGNVLPPVKIYHQAPVYPSMAVAARVEGIVTIEAVISTTGTVQEARVVSSVPLLDEAALAAVRQCRFRPTLLNGVPVPVIMTVKVEFKLR